MWLHSIFAVAFVVLLVVASVGAAASKGEDLAGTVSFRSGEFSDSIRFASERSSAANFLAQDDPLQIEWSLVAEGIQLNWTHDSGPAAANPLNPDSPILFHSAYQGNDSESYVGGVASGYVDSLAAEFLVVGVPETPAFRIEGEFPGTSNVQPAGGEDWRIGTGSAESSRFLRTYDTADGSPLIRTQSTAQFTLSGTFQFTIWGGNVTVQSAGEEPDVYQTGEWKEPLVGDGSANDAAYEGHRQILDLLVQNGTLNAQMAAGSVLFEAAELGLHTSGSTSLDADSARIESSDSVYVATDQSVTLSGNVSLDVRRAPSSVELLVGSLIGTDVAINLPPSGQAPGADDDPSVSGEETLGIGTDSSGGEQASASDQVVGQPSVSPWIILPIWTVILLAAIGAGIWWAARRYGFAAWFRENLPLIVRAEQALVQGDAGRAKRLARRIVAKDPEDVDAWMILGIALLQDDKVEEMVSTLEEVVPSLPQDGQPSLAFLLALGCARLDRRTEAVGWVSIAGREPEILASIRSEASFEPLHGDERFRRVLGMRASRSVDTAYA